ncbi:MAG: family signal peptidase [Frankiales bacterium]|nr:family signal peptidase [Frankiales bacterium]
MAAMSRRSTQLTPWQLIRVEGHSMTPTLLPGDWLLVRHGAPIVAGSVVLGRFQGGPELLVVKRVRARSGRGWHLLSDNAAAGSDSRQHGPADVLARALLRWPGPLSRQLARSAADGAVTGAPPAPLARLTRLIRTARASLPRRLPRSEDEPL